MSVHEKDNKNIMMKDEINENKNNSIYKSSCIFFILQILQKIMTVEQKLLNTFLQVTYQRMIHQIFVDYVTDSFFVHIDYL